jgi:hypothetical protein
MSTDTEQLPLEIQLAQAREEIKRLRIIGMPPTLEADKVTLLHYRNIISEICAELNVVRPMYILKALKPIMAGLAGLRRDKARLDWLADSKKCHFIDAAMEETQ